MKTKFLYLFLFYLLVALQAKSQTWSWVDGIKGGGGGTGIATDTAGNLFISGIGGSNTFTPIGLKTGGAFLAKYDKYGNAMWATGTPTYAGSRAFDVATDKTGNVYITGDFAGQTQFGPYIFYDQVDGVGDMYLTKYDNNGNVLWAKQYFGPDNNTGGAVACDSLGNVYVLGSFRGTSIKIGAYTLTQPNFGVIAGFIMKANSNGNVLWAHRISSLGECFTKSFALDNKGNLYVTGSLTGSIVIIGTTTFTVTSGNDAFIAKYDINGNLIWVNNYVKAEAASIGCDKTGNVYVTGSYWDSTLVLGTYTLTNTGGAFGDYFTAKFDSSGTALWAKDGLNNDNAYGRDISVKGNDVYVTGSFFNSVLLDTFLIYPPSGTSRPVFIAKYDLIGNLLCTSVIGSTGGGASAYLLAEGNGVVNFTGNYAGGSMVVGTNTLATTDQWSGYVAKYSCANSVGIKDLSSSVNFEIYPNPNNGVFKLDNPVHSNRMKIIVINSLGQIVHEQLLDYGENNIATKNLSKGLYNYIIFTNNQRVESGKLIFE